MAPQKNLVNSVDAKTSAKRGLSFTAAQLQKWHWNDGESMQAIAIRHGVSTAAMGYWFQKLHVQHRSNLKEVLFEASPALSYVSGCLLGDGCVRQNPDRHRHWEIRFQVTDKVFAEHFSAAMSLIGIHCGITLRKSKVPNRKDVYLAYAYSQTFGEWWYDLGRSGVAKFSVAYFPDHFVRGFYEAEGCIALHRGRFELAMCNTDEGLIKAVDGAIPKNIRRSLIRTESRNPKWNPHWILAINNSLDIKRFLAWTMPCMKTAPRGYANTEPSRSRNGSEGVENTKAIQNGTRVGRRRATGDVQPQARIQA
jgi:hypothetical protein